MKAFAFPDMQLQYLPDERMFQFTEAYVTPEVTIPKGFKTDGASSGRWLQSLYPSFYKYFPAAAVHDWMYGSGEYDKDEADNLLRDNIRYRLGMSWRYWWLMYWAVRICGASHYTKRKAQGNTVLPVE